ncbi:MFS transporter, partial [Phycicoccus sp. Root563]|uniref:MFS transporter n=1 Tax=Phycicoccus sp. Root563 TaxID=1736562 RepID=UPI00138F8B18
MKETLHTSWPRDVRLAVPAGAVSVAGDAMAMVALTLRIHSTGDGPYAVAVLLACFSLPVVLTMGVAGSLSDRADPRLVLGVGGAVQVLAAAGLATWHSVPATLALVLLLQTGFAFTNPVWSSVLTRAVGDERVGGLVSTQHALAAIAAPVGAALGGVLVQLHGDPVVFVLDALTYLVLVAVGVSLRMRSEPSLGIGGGARAGR